MVLKVCLIWWDVGCFGGQTDEVGEEREERDHGKC